MTQASIYTMAWSGVGQGRAWMIYVLAYKGKNGEMTKTFKEHVWQITGNAAQFLVIARAFRHFTRPCDVALYVEWPGFEEAMRNIAGWKANGWRTSKGGAVRNRELLEEIAGHMAKHEVKVMTGQPHAYRKWMCEELAAAKRGERSDFTEAKSRKPA